MLTTEVMSLDDLKRRKVRIENAEDLKHSQDILALRDAKYGYSLLSLAAGMWDEPTVIRLVAKGHDLLAQNHDGDTPLHIAVRRDFHDVVHYVLELERPELLLAKNNKGQRPLDCANAKGFMMREMIMRSTVVWRMQKAAVAAARKKYQGKKAPLCAALAAKDEESAEALLDGEADPNVSKISTTAHH